MSSELFSARPLQHIATSLACLALLSMSAGCAELTFAYTGAVIALSSDYVPHDVLVRDGDSGQPIAGALVWSPPSQGAFGAESRTDLHGRARIRMARHIGGGFYADADGYLPGHTWTGKVSYQDAQVVLELYRPPEPVSGLTIPVEYRGIVRVRDGNAVKPASASATWKPGQREFYTPINIDGITELQSLPIPRGHRYYGATVSFARFDDGTPLPYANPIAANGWSGGYLSRLSEIRERVPPRGDGVALFNRGSYAEGELPVNAYQVFYVGAETQAAAAQRELLQGATPQTPGRPPGAGRYSFTPLPLSTAHLPVGTQLSPRQHHD